jgi:hypothetical protein
MIRLDDTICPVDFESAGQIDSDTVRISVLPFAIPNRLSYSSTKHSFRQ